MELPRIIDTKVLEDCVREELENITLEDFFNTYDIDPVELIMLLFKHDILDKHLFMTYFDSCL